MKITHMLPLALLALAAGCSKDETARPDPTNIRVFNAAPNFESLTFVREERPEAQLTLGAGQALSFDSGEYEFKVDHAIVGSILPVRAAVVSANLLPNRDYIFIPVSPGSQIEVLLVETDDDPNSETTSRVTFVHAHPAYAGLDVYMVEADIVTGCNLVASQPRGQISFGPNELAFDLDPGIYRICLTAPGDATDLRFESLDIPLLAAGD
jgi:hypothetical protein